MTNEYLELRKKIPLIVDKKSFDETVVRFCYRLIVEAYAKHLLKEIKAHDKSPSSINAFLHNKYKS